MSERNVPAVRFQGFSGEWEKLKLHDIATMKARIGWQGLTQKEFLSEGDYYLITGTDFINGKINFKNCHFIEHERYQQDINIQIKNDDVLITKDGTIGKIAYVTNIDKPATLNAGVFVIRGRTKEILNIYIYHYLAAPYLLKYANEQATGGTIKHLNQNVLVGFPVPISEYDEQAKIGEFFKNLDELIAQNQKKYDKLLNMKKACLDKMFPKDGADTPEVRFKGFNGEWTNLTLSDVADIVGGGTPSTQTPEYWNGEIAWYSPTEIGKAVYANSSQKTITELGLEKCSAKMLPANITVLFTSRAGIGDMAILRHTAATNQGFQSLVTKNGFDPYFLYASGKLIKSYALKYASGSTFLEISGKQLEKMDYQAPNENEQTKIGDFFQTLDNLITLRKTELEKLKNIKKACLDKMFI